MTTVHKDLIADQTLNRTSEGYDAERSYLVDAPGGTPEIRLYNAITMAGIPQYEDPHPVLPDVRVTRISARPVSGRTPNQVKVMVSYSIPDEEDIKASDDEVTASTLNVTTSLQNEESVLDVNGDFMIVEWKGLSVIKKYVRADIQRPQMQANFERRQNTVPKDDIANFLGKINSVPWSGFPAKTWLCSAIDVREDKEGEYDVTYSFSYRPETWRVEATLGLTQEQIDELPPNVDTGNGYGRFDVYKTIDFSSLGLSF